MSNYQLQQRVFVASAAKETIENRLHSFALVRVKWGEKVAAFEGYL